MNYSFPKQEKVISLKTIEALYSKGNYSVLIFPFKISMVFVAKQQSNCQVLITVPKRNFKKAVDRNRIKRQIREIYRLNKWKPYDAGKNITSVELELSFLNSVFLFKKI